jgi:hypothetical protein
MSTLSGIGDTEGIIITAEVCNVSSNAVLKFQPPMESHLPKNVRFFLTTPRFTLLGTVTSPPHLLHEPRWRNRSSTASRR